ncbi:L-asparaginase [Candidatus Fermentibacteria bacterium]|nr:L-asparaginase [Candidatus Fermentibacteria bacterium]
MGGFVLTHGGVGSPPDRIQGCDRAAEKGMAILSEGGSALDAVVEASVILEDDPAYNAGTGSRPRLNGVCEMGASVMTSEGGIGAVAALAGVKNPIRVARMVMERTPHILLAGEGALSFARRMGFGYYDPLTEHRKARLEEALDQVRRGEREAHPGIAAYLEECDTIGVVAVDESGLMAAANSTGGITLMLPGRVGDTPIPGAGLYAGPAGAVATTGVGEEIIRRMSARRIYDLMEVGAHPEEACRAEADGYPHAVHFGAIAVSPRHPGWAANRSMPVTLLGTGE